MAPIIKKIDGEWRMIAPNAYLPVPEKYQHLIPRESEDMYSFDQWYDYIAGGPGSKTTREDARAIWDRAGGAGLKTMPISALVDEAGAYNYEKDPGPDYLTETMENIDAMNMVAPAQYELEEYYRPRYARMERDILKETMTGDQGLLPWYEREVLPSTMRMARKAERAQRIADVEDVEMLGQRAAEAFRSMRPEQMEILDWMRKEIPDSDISRELKKQALSELEMGAELSPMDRRASEQTSRAAWEKRGLLMSPAAAGEEVLDAYNLGEQRKGARRSFAMAVDAEDLKRRGMMGDLSRLYGDASVDPFMTILSRPSTAIPMASSQQAFGSQYQDAGPTYYDPLNPYASAAQRQGSQMEHDVWSTMYQGDIAMDVGRAQTSAAKKAGAMSMFGDIIGAIF